MGVDEGTYKCGRLVLEPEVLAKSNAIKQRLAHTYYCVDVCSEYVAAKSKLGDVRLARYAATDRDGERSSPRPSLLSTQCSLTGLSQAIVLHQFQSSLYRLHFLVCSIHHRPHLSCGNRCCSRWFSAHVILRHEG